MWSRELAVLRGEEEPPRAGQQLAWEVGRGNSGKEELQERRGPSVFCRGGGPRGHCRCCSGRAGGSWGWREGCPPTPCSHLQEQVRASPHVTPPTRTHPLPFRIHAVARHVGPVGQPRGCQGRRLPGDLDGSWGGPSVDGDILWGRRRAWGHRRQHFQGPALWQVSGCEARCSHLEGAPWVKSPGPEARPHRGGQSSRRAAAPRTHCGPAAHLGVHPPSGTTCALFPVRERSAIGSGHAKESPAFGRGEIPPSLLPSLLLPPFLPLSVHGLGRR